MTAPVVLPSTITSLAWQENEAKLVRQVPRFQTGHSLVALGIGVIGALVATVSGVAALCFVALSLIFLAWNANASVSRWVVDAQLDEHIKQKVSLEILLANQKLLEALEPIVQASPTLQTLSSVYTSASAGDITVYEEGLNIISIVGEIAQRNLTNPPTIRSMMLTH